jgi:hypothetical protein
MMEKIDFVTKIPEIRGNPDEFSFEYLGTDDMNVGANHGGLSVEKAIALLVTGQKCIGLRHRGEIAAYMWINLNEIDFASMKIPLKANEAYLWEMRTIGAYRGKNLAPYLRYKSYEILKDIGRNVLYSISVAFNKPTKKYKRKLNAKKLKFFLYIELFHKYRWNFLLWSFRL